MYFPRKLVVAVLLTLVAAGSLALAVGATANRGARSSERAVFRSSLAPCVRPAPTIHGVAECGASWSLERGSVRLGEGGRLDLKVKGLVITATGTALPVTSIAAALFCGSDMNTTHAAITGFFPLSTEGDASIHTTVALPSTCVAPIVLLNFATGSGPVTSRYIALTRFTG